VAKNIPDVV
jgi:hypothetical protein